MFEYSRNQFSRYKLRLRQSMSLDMKEVFSKTRITNWYDWFGGKVYIAFSGGKDSTVLLHIVRSIFPDVPAVYVDTGLEYPEIREFVKTIDNVIFLKPKMNFKEVLHKYGYPVISKEQSQFINEYRNTKSEKLKHIRIYGNKWNRGKISQKWKFMLDAPFKISHKCCQIMKKNPSIIYERESGRVPFLGNMAEESALRKQNYIKHGCNGFTSQRPTSSPISFWMTKDIWNYIDKYKIGYSEIYDMGYERTGCMFCAYGVHRDTSPNRFEKMSCTHPTQHKYCMNQLGLKDILLYMGITEGTNFNG